ncbi:hypothetical protein BJ322DRAFT_875128 [Thelephora terrestris]|uniref:Uncharacterized protein n=1 Tax=Thelephora terrestris TaxID=56493 RepID=A0A9P6HBU3_9AGAM|nr:hypothetical protein BJ322DRAFT_875128 [Thelephora terrestris]
MCSFCLSYVSISRGQTRSSSIGTRKANSTFVARQTPKPLFLSLFANNPLFHTKRTSNVNKVMATSASARTRMMNPCIAPSHRAQSNPGSILSSSPWTSIHSIGMSVGSRRRSTTPGSCGRPYLVLFDGVLNALENLASDREEKKRRISGAASTLLTENPTFPPGALSSMFNASIVSLVLQSGITATATGIVIFTPTIGLGCRSLGYLLYGALSIIIMVLTIISTIFARIAETRGARSSIVRFFTAFIAIALRRICLLLALVNTIDPVSSSRISSITATAT